MKQQFHDIQQQKSKQYVDPPEQKAFTYGLPLKWKEKDLKQYFNEQNFQIKDVFLVKNKIGKYTGKAVFVFNNEEEKNTWINKFNGEFINSEDVLQRIIIKPYKVKSRQSFDRKTLTRANTVYIYNLGYTLTDRQLYEMASDFGNIIKIDLPMQDQEKNKGYSFVTFEKPEAAQQFQEYYNDRVVEFRKMKIQIKNFEFDRQKPKPYIRKYDKILNIENFQDAVKEENKILIDLVTNGQIIDQPAI